MRLLISAAAIGAAMLASSASFAQEAKLRAGVFVPINSAFGNPCKRIVDEINEKGKGLVQVQLLGPEAIPPFELGNAVGSGVLDMACTPPAYYKGKMIEGEATIFSNISFLEHRKTGGWAAMNKLHNEKVGAYYLAAYGDGVKFHFYANKDIKGPEDFKGLKTRSSPNFQAFLLNLGATPLVTPPGEVYTALERGTVEAYGWPLWGIHDQGWDKYTKVRLDPGFYNVAVNVLVNLNKWNSFNDAQRKVLSDSGIWLETNFPKWRDEISATDTKKQQASGVKVVDLGPSWSKRAEDTYFSELEKQSPENMKMLRKLLVKE